MRRYCLVPQRAKKAPENSTNVEASVSGAQGTVALPQPIEGNLKPTELSGDSDGGVQLILPPISSKDWDKSVSRSSAAILVEAGAIEGIDGYSSISFSNESEVRHILSVKSVNKGRQVVTFDGDVITNISTIDYICLKK